ncbi:cadherin domain-containing protein, partial [Pseudoruegeria sp. HB172150]|uniref:cadherin domain-containing protein n=1 Tax=Pseudoruegeria sp. HB172150 TaxID=2721164 RepID=UPI001C131FEC
TGEVSFVSAPDYEAPADTDGDNVYEFEVVASNSLGETTTQAVSVTVTDAGGLSVSDASVTEGHSGTSTISFTVTRTSTAAATYSYAVTGSGDNPADADDFLGGVLPSGTVTFAAGETEVTLSFDISGDTDIEGDETFTLTLTDAEGDTATATGTILNDENAPVFTAGQIGFDAIEVEEDQTAVYDFDAVDADGDTVTYSLGGGADVSLFTIDSATGEVSFVIAPDYEAPADADGDNVYEFEVVASDGAGNSTTQAVSVTVTGGDGLSIADVSLTEGQSGITMFIFTVFRTSTAAAAYSYAVTGSGDNPVDIDDFFYGEWPSGTVTFA